MMNVPKSMLYTALLGGSPCCMFELIWLLKLQKISDQRVEYGRVMKEQICGLEFDWMRSLPQWIADDSYQDTWN